MQGGGDKIIAIDQTIDRAAEYREAKRTIDDGLGGSAKSGYLLNGRISRNRLSTTKGNQ